MVLGGFRSFHVLVLVTTCTCTIQKSFIHSGAHQGKPLLYLPYFARSQPFPK